MGASAISITILLHVSCARTRVPESAVMDLGLRGRSAIVSGGSSGIGLSVARMLDAEGANVLLLGRRAAALRAAVQECGTDGRAEWLAVDVTDPDAGERAVAACLERFGRLDALVNNAGGNDVRMLEQLTDADWQQQWDLHVMAPMHLMRAAVPVMVEAGWGRVVNVGSSSGKRPGRRNAAYSMSKAGQLSLSRSYAEAYAADGVLVNSITPGPTATELMVSAGGLVDQSVQAGGGTRDEVLASIAAGVPRRKVAEPDEIASVVVFLCSELAANVVGAAWSVDGGIVPVVI
jgi:3-oxoacyl-[acyl-carrier protein] reductase